MKKISILLAFSVLLFYSLGWLFCQWAYPYSYRTVVTKYSNQYQLDPLLVGALIFTESRYQEKAVSSAGALGLMQLMPPTAAELALKLKLGPLTEKNYLDKEVNIQLGCYHLAQLMGRLKGQPLELILASYNAGEAKVRKWTQKASSGESPREMVQYPETRKHMTQVLWLYRVLIFWDRLGVL